MDQVVRGGLGGYLPDWIGLGVLSLSAKGLTHGEISTHLAEVYGADVSKQTMSSLTESVRDDMTDWQNRPPGPGLPGGLPRPRTQPNPRRAGRSPANLHGPARHRRGPARHPRALGRR